MPRSATPPRHSSKSDSVTSPWICGECHQPIREVGSLEVYDPTATEPHVYPRTRSESWEEAEARLTQDDAPPTKGLRICKLADLQAVDPIQRIAFRVTHAKCDPRPESHAYNIDVAGIDTMEKWVKTAMHLSKKRWFGFDDMKRALAFWFSNRGLDQNDLD